MEGSEVRLFVRELSLYFIYCLFNFYLAIIVVHIYLNMTVYYQLKMIRIQGGMLDNPDYLISTLYVVTFFSILANIKINWDYRNFRIRGVPENPLIVYMMCLPLLIVSVVGLLYITVYIFIVMKKVEVSLPLSMVLVFVAMIMYLINELGITDTGECWALNYSNALTIFLSLGTLVSTCSYNLMLMHVFAFVGIYNPDSIPCHLNSTATFHFAFCETFNKLIGFYQSGIILLSVTYVLYFIAPLRRNISALEKKLEYDNENTLEGETRKIATKFDYVINGLLLLLLIIPRVLLFFNRDHMLRILVEVLSTVEICIMVALIVYIFFDIRFWMRAARALRINVYNQVILWVGMCGELIYIASNFLAIFSGIYSEYTGAFMVTTIIRFILQFVQVLFQTLLICSITHRDITKLSDYKFKRIWNILNPFISLAVINVVLGLYAIVPLHPDTFDFPWESAFIIGSNSMSRPLGAMFRAFGAIMFLKHLF